MLFHVGQQDFPLCLAKRETMAPAQQPEPETCENINKCAQRLLFFFDFYVV